MNQITQQKINRVSIGSRVKVFFQNGDIRTFEITDTSGIPAQGILNCESPLGRALLGGGEGETISYRVNGKLFIIQIIEVIAG